MSENYFLYRDASLAHKVVLFYEMSGTASTAYTLRSAFSEGVLRLGTVTKNNQGSMETKEVEKPCDGMVMLSTYAAGEVDKELNTRVLRIELTHDEQLGRRILRHKGKMAQAPAQNSSTPNEPFYALETGIAGGSMENGSSAQSAQGVDENLLIWQIADYLIEPATVIVPFADGIADLFPINQERLMRDFDKVISLIKASALLHQYQRERDEMGRIIATEDDYALVYRLKDAISQGYLRSLTIYLAFCTAARIW
ncbi:hypothetical protein [Candidatus Magnetominusculus xianensis]|uniref:Uncharacterized protein n=1 Tax=Candidatus Magnetominusculus xianensis TaxID=1748249 RepID=A0ABR5SD37_9BACT|nr:hypothetical protein [Candidatus Magnetominusculus xianensis]KWT75953.1 hypothetical protein ASN18_3194 [Candidatus Magnetominusculus xianensis]MBF0405045.1 hypothetical protein [Nitrospirota bacterium]